MSSSSSSLNEENSSESPDTQTLIEADVTNGRLISFIESHTRVHDRQVMDGKMLLKTVMGRRTLADLSRNDQVAVKTVGAVK